MDVYDAKKSNKRKIGFIFLFIWAALLAGAIAISVSSNGQISYTGQQTKAMGSLTSWAVMIMPFWVFLLMRRKWFRLILGIPLALIAFLMFLYTFLIATHKTRGRSMEPSFISGEYILSEKVSLYFNGPKRGDVVVFLPPKSDGYFFARVVGLPGEEIAIRNGKVYINDEILPEPYLSPGTATEIKKNGAITEIGTLIPQGKYAVMGDNRANSFDSRDYGFIEKSAITGRFYLIYWPKDSFRFVGL